jgi:hypothetical protein
MASLAMPESIVPILRWCEFIVSSQGHYRTALERVLSYFITDIDIADADDEEKEKYQQFLEDTIGIYDILHRVGMDYLTYGNAFVSVLTPFKRYLSCPKCFIEHPLAIIFNNEKFNFEWNNFEFHATCQSCKYKGKWKCHDRKGGAEGIRIKRWSPHEIEILEDHLTGDCDYFWKIPADYKKQLSNARNNLYMLERANMEIIEAIKHNESFRFAKNVIFHLKEEGLAGIRRRGWGISRILSNFRQSWYVQVLHRYNEAIALDYIIPFRVITPAPGPGGGNPEAKDPVFNFNMGGFVGRIRAMLNKRRRDPASWNILPFPVEYKALGGDAKALAPKDLLDQGIELLLNNVGVPVEMFKGSLQVQTAPAALRLFESHWTHLVNNLNRLLRFISNRLSELLSWEKVTIKLTRVTTADDLNKQMAKLQLMTGHQISQQTGLKSVGVDWKAEVRRMLEEQKYQAEKEMEMQGEMDQQGLAQQMSPTPQQQMAQGIDPNTGQPMGGGQQGGGGGGDPSQQGMMMPPPSPVDEALATMPMNNNIKITPEEMMSKAQTLAQQILGLPEAQKDSQLISLKKQNPTLHALVKSNMESFRQQARTAGGAMIMSQNGMGGGQPPPQ